MLVGHLGPLEFFDYNLGRNRMSRGVLIYTSYSEGNLQNCTLRSLGFEQWSTLRPLAILSLAFIHCVAQPHPSAANR